MKTPSLILGLLGLALIAICVYIFATPHTLLTMKRPSEKVAPARTPTLSQEYVEVPVVTYTEMSDSVPSLRYAYNINYPTVALLGHPDMAKATNAVIKTFVLDLLNAFKKNVEPDGAEPNADDMSSDFTMRAGVQLLSPTIVSFRFDSAEYVSGSAHPSHQTHILNYDIENGVVMRTEDLFASSSVALPLVAKHIQEMAKANISDTTEKEEFDTMFLAGTLPTLENFRSIALSKEGLRVYFDEYQVAPYSRGGQEFLIPIDKIQNLLSKRTSEAIRQSKANIEEMMPENTGKMMEQ